MFLKNQKRGSMKHIRCLITMLYVCGSTSYACAYKNLQDDNRLDVMTYFAYPMQETELIRHDITQGIYFLQQDATFEQGVAMLELADSRSLDRANMTSDDEDFLQAMLDQINSLIDSLEGQDAKRSRVSDVYTRLQGKL